MTVSASFVDYVLGQLTGLGGVSSRRMFGGVGLYCQGRFFGLIDKDTLYLKVDERNRPHYVSRRMAPFRPYKDRPEVSMSYYETPAEVIEDAEQLIAWARESLRAAAARPARDRRSESGARKNRKGSERKARR